ncbi:unnamed protein product [Prorocentrum cordatum]|uniref:Uncharacterized protein n=1 Tax=Prorocentrum cordatum TaxID=2364126 RepID=A0ABN9XEK1_9DINO|nr:unnamed protein product [Polarella glacialis]
MSLAPRRVASNCFDSIARWHFASFFPRPWSRDSVHEQFGSPPQRLRPRAVVFSISATFFCAARNNGRSKARRTRPREAWEPPPALRAPRALRRAARPPGLPRPGA